MHNLASFAIASCRRQQGRSRILSGTVALSFCFIGKRTRYRSNVILRVSCLVPAFRTSGPNFAMRLHSRALPGRDTMAQT